MNDIEQRLRDALHSSAGEVVPDPNTWRRVEQRVRRARMLTWAGAGAGMAAAAIAAFAIVTSLRPVDRVELRPNPVATQPGAPEGTFVYPGADDLDPANFPGPATGYVFTDGESTAAINLETNEMRGLPFVGCADSYPDCYQYGPTVLPDVAMSPLPATMLVGVVLQMGFERCHEATAFEATQTTDSTRPISEGCASSIALSPDGAFAAVGISDTDTVQLVPMPRQSPPGAVDPVDLGLHHALVDITVDDWFEDESGDWHLLVSGTRGPSAQGRRSVFAVPLQRDAPNPTVGGRPVALEDVDGWTTITVDGGYALQVRYEMEDGELPAQMRLTRLGTAHAVPVPAQVLESARSKPSQPWLAADELSVMVGDGMSMAWTVTYAGSLSEAIRKQVGVSDDKGFSPFAKRDEAILAADFYRTAEGAVETASEEPDKAARKVDVFFVQRADPEAGDCTAVTSLSRQVEGPGVLRGALTELLKGPTAAEKADGYTSIFGPATTGTLNDVEIDAGIAHVDLADFRDEVSEASTSCGSTAMLTALDATVLQFPTIEQVVYSLDGSVSAFYDFVQRPAPNLPVREEQLPLAVEKTREAIRLAAGDGNLDRLRALITTGEDFMCLPGPGGRSCVAFWEEQAQGGKVDPFGKMLELLGRPPQKQSFAERYVWAEPVPADAEEPEGGPASASIGIDADGTWSFFLQPNQ